MDQTKSLPKKVFFCYIFWQFDTRMSLLTFSREVQSKLEVGHIPKILDTRPACFRGRPNLCLFTWSNKKSHYKQTQIRLTVRNSRHPSYQSYQEKETKTGQLRADCTLHSCLASLSHFVTNRHVVLFEYTILWIQLYSEMALDKTYFFRSI